MEQDFPTTIVPYLAEPFRVALNVAVVGGVLEVAVGAGAAQEVLRRAAWPHNTLACGWQSGPLTGQNAIERHIVFLLTRT